MGRLELGMKRGVGGSAAYVRATCFIARTVKELSGLAWLGSNDADSHDVTVLFFQ